MRNPSGTLGTHFTGETTTLARLLTIDRADGVQVRLTDHDADLTIAARAEAASGTLTLDPTTVGSAKAAGNLTITDGNNALNNETVVIDGKTYTFQTTLTDSDGNVQIGADRRESLHNLASAINLDSGAGTKYAASTTAHPTVDAIAPSLDPDDYTVSSEVTLIATGEGSILSNISRSSYLFNGNTGGWPVNVARKTSSPAYGGKDFSSDPQRVAQARVYSSDWSFCGSAGLAGRITFELRGANGSFPGDPTTGGTLLGSASKVDAADGAGSNSNATITNTDDPTKLWDYVWVVLSASISPFPDFCVAEIRLYAPVININPGVDWEGNMGVVAQSAGFAGNEISTTETLTDGSFDSTELAGGSDVYFNALDGETVTIDSKVYTFQDTLTNSDGNVQIGADAEESLGNLIAAINLDSGAGTKYAAATTEHPTVGAAVGSSTNTMAITADTPGDDSNSLSTSETLTNGAWGGSSLSGGFTSLFESVPGFTASAVLSSSRLGIQGLNISLPEEATTITQEDLNLNLYKDAQAMIEYVNWAAPDDGTMILFAGVMGDVSNNDDGEIEIEIHGRFTNNRQVRINSYSPTCRADLGDADCQYDIEADRVEFTIDTVLSQNKFQTTELGQADDFWKLGVVRFTSGNNEGFAMEVMTSAQADGEITLFLPAPLPLQVGDTGEVWPGCDKSIQTCKDRFENVLNFRGEPFAPQEGDIYAYKG